MRLYLYFSIHTLEESLLPHQKKPDYEQKQIEKLRLYLNLDKNDFFSPQKKSFCL